MKPFVPPFLTRAPKVSSSLPQARGLKETLQTNISHLSLRPLKPLQLPLHPIRRYIPAWNGCPTPGHLIIP